MRIHTTLIISVLEWRKQHTKQVGDLLPRRSEAGKPPEMTTRTKDEEELQEDPVPKRAGKAKRQNEFIMPIINGTYVTDSLPNPKDAQKQVFGSKYTTRDMSDYSAAAYNYLMQQQSQAYNLDLWRLQNEYNSPEAQMLRYQQAGLNPNLVYGQQNLGVNAASASPPSFRSAGTYAKSVANQLNTIAQIQGLVKSARDTFDYMQYGAETNRWRMIGAQEQALGQKLNNEWMDYLNHGDAMIYGDTTRLVNGPRALMQSQEQALRDQQWRRIEYMITTLMPDQHAANQALTTLRENQAAIQDGKYGAVLDIDLGLGEKVNQWARMIIFLSLAKFM